MTRVVRTLIVRSVKLPRRIFRVFVELEGMYRNMVEQLVVYAVRNNVKSFTRLKALKYREMRNLYPYLPSHYVYTACQDASTRAKSFLRLRKLREKKKKNDIKWKTANIIVRTAYEKQYTVVLEKLGKRPANNMIKRIKNKQLRHRVFQASFRGIQRAIKEKAGEYGVPVIYVDPRNTSKTCPIHNAPIIYSNSSRIGRCSKGGEPWHRDVAATWNLFFKALRGDGSHAPSPGGQYALDGSPVPKSGEI